MGGCVKKLKKKLAKRGWLAKISAMTTTTIPYTLPSGRTAIITVEPSNFLGRTIAEVSATVEGVGSPILGGRSTPAGLPAWAVCAIGKLPLTAEINALVDAAVDAIESAAAAANAAVDAKMAALDALSASSAAMARRMAYGDR